MINPETTTQLRLLLLFSCLFAALHGTMASAVAMPPATGSVVIPLDAQSPRPTEAPIMVELARRQSPFTYIVAPDGICGWNSQNTDSAYLLFTSQDTKRKKTKEKKTSYT